MVPRRRGDGNRGLLEALTTRRCEDGAAWGVGLGLKKGFEIGEGEIVVNSKWEFGPGCG